MIRASPCIRFVQSGHRLASGGGSAGSSPSVPFYKKPIVVAAFALWTGVGIYASRKWASNRSGSGAAEAQKVIATLRPNEFVELKLQKVIPVSHNSSIFRFKLPSDQHILGGDVAWCLLTKADLPVKDSKTGETVVKPVIRPYTPITSPTQQGYADLLIKKYPNGPMSEHIFSLKPGDGLLFKGPIAKIPYEANKWSHIGMIAGGTGITPMWQVIQKCLSDPADKTKITLIYGNITSSDILMKSELDELAKKHKDRFRVFYTLDKPEKEWSGFSGYVNKDMLSKAGMPQSSEKNSIVFVCGNEPMMKSVSGTKNPDKSQGEVDPKSVLGQLGFTKDEVFKF